MAKEPVAHDEAPSVIVDHPFEPSGKWWSLCATCNLAQAAHSSSTINTQMEMVRDHMEAYGEVRHVDRDRKADLERQFREYERKRIHSGGRGRIGYVGDDDDE